MSGTGTNGLNEAVLRSLGEQPALNTPTLIAMSSSHIPAGTEKAEIERALEELVAAGRVIHGATGWKLAPSTA